MSTTMTMTKQKKNKTEQFIFAKENRDYGFTRKEISTQLNLEYTTVWKHVKNSNKLKVLRVDNENYVIKK